MVFSNDANGDTGGFIVINSIGTGQLTIESSLSLFTASLLIYAERFADLDRLNLIKLAYDSLFFFSSQFSLLPKLFLKMTKGSKAARK